MWSSPPAKVHHHHGKGKFRILGRGGGGGGVCDLARGFDWSGGEWQALTRESPQENVGFHNILISLQMQSCGEIARVWLPNILESRV